LLSNCEMKQSETESVGAWRVQIVFKCISLIPPCGASRPRFACCWGYRGAWETHRAGRETSCPTFCIVLVVIHRSIGGVVHRGNRIVLINIGRIVSLIVALWQFAGLHVLSKQVLKNGVARFTVYVLPLLGDRPKFRNEKLERARGAVYYNTCKHPWVRHLVLCLP
jgi:hypothetical protein